VALVDLAHSSGGEWLTAEEEYRHRHWEAVYLARRANNAKRDESQPEPVNIEDPPAEYFAPDVSQPRGETPSQGLLPRSTVDTARLSQAQGKRTKNAGSPAQP
jgi:hypothetical protein